MMATGMYRIWSYFEDFARAEIRAANLRTHSAFLAAIFRRPGKASPGLHATTPLRDGRPTQPNSTFG